ncbi:MAG TPA: long-chain fatty acid--CoA ligase [Candidatus Melainabacteria bacterium]|nr:long-chain fatty acid--CoA ligase [Candidatus Melainabacteria bacterium]
MAQSVRFITSARRKAENLTYKTIVDVFWERVATMSERPAIMHKVDGKFRPVIWREHGRTVELTAGGLISLSVMPGEKLAIMSQSRPHWTWTDLASLSIGAVTVPIYPTLAAPEAQFLVRHSDAVGVFCENDVQLRKIQEAKDLPESLRFVVLMEGEPKTTDPRFKTLSWNQLLEHGEIQLGKDAQALPERIKNLKPEDLATIVYTSGTTGIPKGAMLLHSNIMAVCEAMHVLVGLNENDLALSFLPLSHVYERVGGQMISIYEGLVVAFAESIEQVPKNMIEVRPTVLNGVPRFYEKAYQRIQVEIRKLPKPQQYLIRWAMALGKRALHYKKAAQFKHEDHIVNQILKAELRVADRLVFSRIRRRFGGRLRVMVSGAAPLSPNVQEFFEIIGLNIVEGYGLTETSAPVACNTPEENHPGTVGKPMPGVEVKIAEDGEILVKGPSIFAGYYKNEEATNAALSNGWFSTGDIGEIDASGRLKIKDRKKDIIITSNGKHVAPQYIENLFKGENLISHILVYGDRRKYVSALITLSRDGLRAFAEANALPVDDLDKLTQHPKVREEVEAVVKRKNEPLANFERIKKFVILEHDFTVENDELTPTFKVKRKVITEKYRALLDSCYEAEDVEVGGGVPETAN